MRIQRLHRSHTHTIAQLSYYGDYQFFHCSVFADTHKRINKRNEYYNEMSRTFSFAMRLEMEMRFNVPKVHLLRCISMRIMNGIGMRFVSLKWKRHNCMIGQGQKKFFTINYSTSFTAIFYAVIRSVARFPCTKHLSHKRNKNTEKRHVRRYINLLQTRMIRQLRVGAYVNSGCVETYLFST